MLKECDESKKIISHSEEINLGYLAFQLSIEIGMVVIIYSFGSSFSKFIREKYNAQLVAKFLDWSNFFYCLYELSWICLKAHACAFPAETNQNQDNKESEHNKILGYQQDDMQSDN